MDALTQPIKVVLFLLIVFGLAVLVVSLSFLPRTKKLQIIVRGLAFSLLVSGVTIVSVAYYMASKKPFLERNLPNPPVKVQYWLNNEIDQVGLSRKGVLLHNIPAEMTVQNKEIIEVRAAKKISLELTQRLAGNGDAEISQVKVLSTMGTILTGTENYFDIDLKNTEEKTIEGNEFAQWIYEVTPEEAGTPDLYLTLYLVLETPEGKYKYELPTIRKTVTVRSNAVATGTSFLTRNWKELIGFVIALGVIGASANLLRQWWEKRTTREETNNAESTDEES